MPETIEYLKDSGFVKIESFGKANIEDWKKSLSQAVMLGKEHGISSVLVDSRRQETTPKTLDLFNFGAELPRKFRFAVLTSESLAEDHYFLETVGKNRGHIIQLFHNYENAVKWLKGKD